jgi:F-type H+-transporting ATPase subunit a
MRTTPIFSFLLTLLVTPLFAHQMPIPHDDHEEVTAQVLEIEEKEDVNDVIMHHISDAHDWHIFDWNDHAVSVPLPVILYTDKGLVSFMSSAFHHDDSGKEVVEKSGQRFVKYHEKIYYASSVANADGSYIDFDDEHHALNAKPLDISITKNVASLFVTIFLMLIIFLPAANFYKKNGSQKAPKGIASFVEPLIIYIRDEVALVNIGKKHYLRFTPYLLSLFFFVWLANMLGLMPVIPGGANLTGNIGFTMVLAIFTLLITNFNGKKDYWMHILWMPGVPVPVRLLLAPIEIVGILTKPFALMVRLFANMTAGHIVILSLISLIFVLETIWVSPAAVLLTVFIFVIKVLVAFLQAYIFALLTALFIGQAVEEHAHH